MITISQYIIESLNGVIYSIDDIDQILNNTYDKHVLASNYSQTTTNTKNFINNLIDNLNHYKRHIFIVRESSIADIYSRHEINSILEGSDSNKVLYIDDLISKEQDAAVDNAIASMFAEGKEEDNISTIEFIENITKYINIEFEKIKMCKILTDKLDHIIVLLYNAEPDDKIKKLFERIR